MFFKHTTYWVLLIISFIVPAYGNERTSELNNEYSVELLTEEDGFVSSVIYSIVQDKQGILWFGTGENGVMKYDGRKVSLIEYNPLNDKGLSHNDAGNLMLDHTGKIWVGTWGGGANVYEPETGDFTHFSKNPQNPNSLSSNRIQSLLHDQEHNIWLGSYDQGLSLYLGQNNFKNIGKIEGDKTSLSHNRVWDIENKDKNNLWIATSFGLNLLDKNNLTFTHYFPEPENLSPTGANEIRSILKTSKNEIYLGTQKGPFKFNFETKIFTPITMTNGDYLGQVNSMIEDRNGNIWIVSSKGLFRQSKSRSHIERFELKHNTGLRIVFEDSSRTIWVTNETHGIYKIVPHRKFKSINSTMLKAPNAITVDRNGDLLIVTSLTELYKWHVSSQTLEKLSSPVFSDENTNQANRLLEMPIVFPDNNDNIWIAQDSNLAKFNLKTQKIELLKYPETDPWHKSFRELRALNMDKEGNLLIGTYKNGIYRYNPANKSFFLLDDSFGLSHPEVSEIFVDKDQNVWVGTGDGLNIWDNKFQRFISFENDENKIDGLLGNTIQDIHQSRDGNIWIATQKGLNLYLPKAKSFKHYGRKNGLPTSLVRGISDDMNGFLWLTTNKGISKLDPLTGKVTNFDRYNGLLGLNYYPHSLIKANNETMFASSQRGIEFFNSAPVVTNNRDFNVVLTGFKRMGKPVNLNKPYSYVKDIYLTHKDYFFSFEFSVLDFIAPNKNQYAYKLEGYDDNWINIGNRNVASFTNLDGGTYKFLVKATNSSGKWGNNLLSINLHIAPPSWKSWWAYTFYILMGMLSIILFVYFRTQLQRNEIARQKQFVLSLEEQVIEKTASLKTQAQDLIEANKKLEILTYQDGLTGLYNRRYFDQKLSEELSRHFRQKQPLSLIIADIDHFKPYNDFYGHQQGDSCLKEVAECIRTSVGRITDANCRYGGEEFAIILPNTTVEESTIVAERLCRAVEDLKIPHGKSDTSSFITLTLGVVTTTSEEKVSADSIVLGADKALYQGKSAGRNRVIRAD